MFEYYINPEDDPDDFIRETMHEEQPCILCGKATGNRGMFLLEDSQELATLQEKKHVLIYALCELHPLNEETIYTVENIVKSRLENATSENIRSFYDGHWEWFMRTEPAPYEITGKYLFFSPHRDLLVDIAAEELTEGGFHHAKIPMIGKNLTSEYVLCLYYKDDSRKQELASKYRSRKGIKYRYWKSDEATLEGEYSKEFHQAMQRQMSQKVLMYVQYPDFSIDEKGDVDLDSAIIALNNFSWDISVYSDYDPEDFAYPTIGFQDSNGSLIELCRLEEGYHVRLDYVVKKKALFRKSNSREMKFGVVRDLKFIERLLGHFFKSEFEIIESQL